jgi:hypothetical protein
MSSFLTSARSAGGFCSGLHLRLEMNRVCGSLDCRGNSCRYSGSSYRTAFLSSQTKIRDRYRQAINETLAI